MQGLSDIWFFTDLELETLGQHIGLSNIRYDGENYWDWIIGKLGSLQIDITRTNTMPPAQTETRIFIYRGASEFDSETAQTMVLRLQSLGITPVYLGKWIFDEGEKYIKHVLQTKVI